MSEKVLVLREAGADGAGMEGLGVLYRQNPMVAEIPRHRSLVLFLIPDVSPTFKDLRLLLSLLHVV